MPAPCPVPAASFLADYTRSGAYTDCYTTTVPGVVGLPEFVEAFYTTRLFKLERWLLARALGLKSSDTLAQQLARGETERFAAWRVEQRSSSEILLDAGQTRSWLSVQPSAAGTTLRFGSAVVPRRREGGFGWVFHALLGLHRVYSRLLLSAAARRVIARRDTR